VVNIGSAPALLGTPASRPLNVTICGGARLLAQRRELGSGEIEEDCRQLIDFIGAGEGNRTLVVSLGSFCSTIELHPRQPHFTVFCRAAALFAQAQQSNENPGSLRYLASSAHPLSTIAVHAWCIND
jgi:hypothetical protein